MALKTIREFLSSVAAGFRRLFLFIIRHICPCSRINAAENTENLPKKRQLPTRAEQLELLQSQDFDILIIGGGATGTGCALDAVTRGLKTALVEMDDFASGTSSRSTKLVHGGVRYLQKAISEFDIEQYRMVKEALRERAWMMKSAPYLTHPIPIMLPVYNWWQVPYFWFGMKMYDLVAGSRMVKSSYFLSKRDTLEKFPMLRAEKLCGSIIYYDGQQNDARMNLTVAITATRYGATVANHVKVTSLIHETRNGHKVICGANLRDELTGKEWKVKAKCVINATGPMTDSVRKMDDKTAKEICSPSSGVHVVLPAYYSPRNMGLFDPSTSDGRVIFVLPWQGQTIAGTTDGATKVTHNPEPTEDEIMFILSEIKKHFNPDIEVRRGDVTAAWCGIRPLVSDPNKGDTQSLARNHIVHVSDSNLITIAGGKWTTYRSMAMDTIDVAIKACNLDPKIPTCQTEKILLEGAHGWTPTMYIRLIQDFGLETDVAEHLANSYGDKAFDVAKLGALTGKRWPVIGKKIHPDFPYIDAEIRYGVCEYACSLVDMIARRIRLSFLNVQAAQEALPEIATIMSEQLNWNEEEKQKQIENALIFLQNEMGYKVNKASTEKAENNLTKDEIQLYTKKFENIDTDKKGFASSDDIKRSLMRFGEKEAINEELSEIICENDTNKNGQIELDEYLQTISSIKSGHVAYSRFARLAEMEEIYYENHKIPVQNNGDSV